MRPTSNAMMITEVLAVIDRVYFNNTDFVQSQCCNEGAPCVLSNACAMCIHSCTFIPHADHCRPTNAASIGALRGEMGRELNSAESSRVLCVLREAIPSRTKTGLKQQSHRRTATLPT